MDGDIGIAIMKDSGIVKSFKQVVRAASKEMTSLMLDRRIDAVVLGMAYNHRPSAKWKTASRSPCSTSA